MAQTRRAFLSMLGAASAAVAASAAGTPLSAALVRRRPSAAKLERIGIQLYSLRKLAAADLASVLARLAKIGYTEIELAGLYTHSAAEVRELLVANKLTAPSSHVGIDVIERHPDATFGDAKIIGQQWITVPSPSRPTKTLDDWKTFAARLNHAAQLAKSAGLKFAYHNHEVEFQAVEEKTAPWDVLMAETDPALVFAQIDLYHAVNGGANPLDLIARHGPRITMLHVKDRGAIDGKMVDIGAGTIDFKTIFANAKGIEHYFVENDFPVDPFAFAAKGYDYLSKLTF